MKFTSKEQLKKCIEDELPILNTDSVKIMKWLKENDFEYSELKNDMLYASIIIEKKLITVKKLLITFIFTKEKFLKETIIKEGIIAP